MRPKPKQLLTVIIILAMVLLALAVRLWPRTVPYAQCSDLYKRYAAVDDIDATFIKGYQVNDTLFLDVTLLEAKTDSAWVVLQSDFHVPIIPEEYRELLANSSSVDFWLASKKDPTIRTDTIISHNDLIVMSRQKQTISVCHIENKRQADAIMDKKTNELSKSKNTKQ